MQIGFAYVSVCLLVYQCLRERHYVGLTAEPLGPAIVPSYRKETWNLPVSGKLSKRVLVVAHRVTWLRLWLLPCFQHDPHFSCWIFIFLMLHHTQSLLP